MRRERRRPAPFSELSPNLSRLFGVGVPLAIIRAGCARIGQRSFAPLGAGARLAAAGAVRLRRRQGPLPPLARPQRELRHKSRHRRAARYLAGRVLPADRKPTSPYMDRWKRLRQQTHDAARDAGLYPISKTATGQWMPDGERLWTGRRRGIRWAASCLASRTPARRRELS